MGAMKFVQSARIAVEPAPVLLELLLVGMLGKCGKLVEHGAGKENFGGLFSLRSALLILL